MACERTLREGGWCARWEWCKTFCGDCKEGGDRALLCLACDAAEDARERAALGLPLFGTGNANRERA